MKQMKIPFGEESPPEVQNDENVDPQLPSRTYDIQQSIKITSQEELIYAEEILDYLIYTSPQVTSENYFLRQSDIKEHMRAVLLNWLIDVHMKYKLQVQTYFTTVHLIDSYLSKKVILRGELQLLGITSLWIASKFEETYQIPTIDNLVFMCDSTYSSREIQEMEGKILEEIAFQFKATASVYYDHMASLASLSSKDQHLGRYLLEATTFQIHFNSYPRHILAFAIVFFIKRIRGITESHAELAVYNNHGINEKSFKVCIRSLCLLWQKMETMDVMSSLRAKYAQKKYFEVSKIRMSEKSK